uniref:BHLH domain-containing protein n=1 Tax=Oryza meridionalis TaxID=40149 RepID=A0A0E0EML2_9ORYZ
MGLQGNKATHDFLSLYAAAATATDYSPLPRHPDSKPPAPAPPPAQDFFLKTHDFLPQVEKRADQPPPPQPHAAATAEKQLLHHHALAAAGAFTISHAAAAAATATAVKQEPPFAPWCQPVAAVDPRGHQWSLPFAARAVAVVSSRPQQQPPPPERKGGGGFMDAGSRSSGGAGFDDDDGHAARREVSSSLKELTVRVEGKGGSCSGSAGTDQMPNTPRSKHSATEQRRRSKINDSLHFKLHSTVCAANSVIEYIRTKAKFLQIIHLTLQNF